MLNKGQPDQALLGGFNLFITIFIFLLNTTQKYCMFGSSRDASSLLTCLRRATVGSSQIVLQDVFTR